MGIKPSKNKLKIMIGISLAAGMIILPFSIFRFLQQDLIMGMFDLILSLGLILFAVNINRTKDIDFAASLLLTLTLIVLLLIMYNKGVQMAYWIYPTLASSYFLLKYKTAALYSCFVILLLIPFLYLESSLLTFSTILATLIITLAFSYFFAAEEHYQHEMLLGLAVKDPLTGACNRRALSEKLNNLIALFQRTGNNVTILLLDIDHFKRINDTYGHNVGDNFLVQLTKTLKSRIRLTDTLYRYGGEEFIIVTENTCREAGQTLAEKLRGIIEQDKLIPETTATISIGVAELQANENESNWIKRADEALFRAKKSGRNLVCI